MLEERSNTVSGHRFNQVLNQFAFSKREFSHWWGIYQHSQTVYIYRENGNEIKCGETRCMQIIHIGIGIFHQNEIQ